MSGASRREAAPGERARPLGLLSLLAFGINGIVGVGIFFAPSEVAASAPGYAGVAIYLVTGLALLPIAWAFGMLGARFDIDGGPYVWARAAFGRTFAFFVGWMTYVAALFSASAVVSGLGRHAAPALGIEGEMGVRTFAVVCALVLALVAASGLRPSAIAWSGVTVLKLLPLVFLAGLGTLAAVHADVTEYRMPTADLERAALVVVFTCQGFEGVPVMAGSLRGKRVALPIATIGSLVVAVTLYALLQTTAVVAVPSLAASATPLVDAAGALGGEMSGAAIALGANISATGVVFGTLVLTPRYLAVLGDPEGLGPWVAEEDPRRVPQRALWLTVLGVSLLVAVGDLGQLFVLSSVAVLAQYAVGVAALSWFAWRTEHGLSRRHLWPAPLAAVGLSVAARGAEWAELATAALVLAFGGALLIAVRRRDGHVA